MTPILTEIPSPGYVQAAEVPSGSRLLFISGQIPQRPDGTVPEAFEEQCEQVWRNILASLEAAGMTHRNLVKVTTFLSRRDLRDSNSRIRQRVLDGHHPAVTVIITGIYDEQWLLEIEAVAAAAQR
ncbi:hypothetical protein GCM10010112_52680 [Actinoplanes lobatus]|nr:hypothetical protein GCM10010112_52680 [Actinoplanes lobatus]